MTETALVAIISASAAVLASLLTALASLGVVHLQEKRRASAAEGAAFQAAAQIVLSKGLSIIDRANLLSAVVRSESTPLAGVAVLLRLRNPANRLGLLESLAADQEEIRFAGAHVALHGDQATVSMCNTLLRAATAVAQAVSPTRERSVLGFAKAMIMGLPQPNPERIREAAEELTESRQNFANHLRRLRALSPVDVYGALPNGSRREGRHDR